MDPNDREQTELLRLIWTEMKALGQNLGERIDRTNERLDTMRGELKSEIAQTNRRLDGMNARLEDTNARLEETNTRLDETNTRLGSVEEHLRDLAARELMLGLDRRDDAIDELRERVTRIETRLEEKG